MTATLAQRMQRVVRRDIQSMHGYAVQPSAGLVKIDTMENPFRLPPALRRALGERLAEVALNRYPAERGDVLRHALAAHAGMPEGCELMLGNGSDELISMLAMACDVPGNVVLAPLPGFVMYELAARLQGLAFVGVPLTGGRPQADDIRCPPPEGDEQSGGATFAHGRPQADELRRPPPEGVEETSGGRAFPREFELDLPSMLAAVREHRPALVYLAYPNNPTANLWDDTAIDAIIEAAPGLVVMDEAYQPFAARDSMARLVRHEHVLLMRTMSKFGLAGVRIGYLMGRRELIREIDKLRPPFNISVLNCEAALFALEHADEYARQAGVIRTERERLQAALQEVPGVRPFPSEANMILVRVADAKRTFDAMKARGVLVKNVAALHPLLAGCLRITVGTPEENILMIEALKASVR